MNSKKNIIIIRNNISFIYEHSLYHSLLESLEHNYINIISYQCRSGYCGICRTVLITGKIKYHKNILPLNYLQPNEILPCCCHPITNLILKL